LLPVHGVKAVTALFIDRAGNVGAEVSGGITLDAIITQFTSGPAASATTPIWEEYGSGIRGSCIMFSGHGDGCCCSGRFSGSGVGVCVCVSVCAREKESECESVSVCVSERESE